MLTPWVVPLIRIETPGKGWWSLSYTVPYTKPSFLFASNDGLIRIEGFILRKYCWLIYLLLFKLNPNQLSLSYFCEIALEKRWFKLYTLKLKVPKLFLVSQLLYA